MKLALKERLLKGATLQISFKIAAKNKNKGKEQELKLLVKVLRCDLVDPDMGTYHVGLKFLDIRPPQQDLIMAYIFERMVERKRRQ